MNVPENPALAAIVTEPLMAPVWLVQAVGEVAESSPSSFPASSAFLALSAVVAVAAVLVRSKCVMPTTLPAASRPA